MSYFDEGRTLPAPFNMVPSPKSWYYLVLRTKACIVHLCKAKGRRHDNELEMGMLNPRLKVRGERAKVKSQTLIVSIHTVDASKCLILYQAIFSDNFLNTIFNVFCLFSLLEYQVRICCEWC
jgi:hypothetical protein